MKKLFMLLVITVVSLVILVASAYASSWLWIEDYGDCEIVGQHYVIRIEPEKIDICSVTGDTEPHQWGGEETLYLGHMKVSWWWESLGGCGAGGPGYPFRVGVGPHFVYKSDFCTSDGKPKPRSGGPPAPKPIALPPRQIWALTVTETSWCWFYGGTPLIFEGGVAVCFPGSPWPLANDFCLRISYGSLKGCQPENYDVIDLSNLIL